MPRRVAMGGNRHHGAVAEQVMFAVDYLHRMAVIVVLRIEDILFDQLGHMPGFPLMPGVVMCECAAQLAGFYARKYNILGGDYVGFGGMNDVKFRFPVFPGDRLVLMAKVTKVRPHRRAEFDFQGFVGDRMVFCGCMFGVPITRDQKID